MDPSGIIIIALDAIAFFAAQLLFCVKASNIWAKLGPAYLVGASLVLSLSMYLGAFGKADFNMHEVVAQVVALMAGIAGLGIAAAWIVYKTRFMG
jgi:hypothetical protein